MQRNVRSRLALSASLVGALLVGVSTPSPAVAASFAGLDAPARIADTRQAGSTVDGAFERGGKQQGGTTLELEVAGRAGIDDDALAVVLNVTTTGAERRGFITVHPCDTDRPNSANLNFEAGQIIANAVIAKLDNEGTTCIYTSATANIVVDATGALPDGAFEPLDAPARIVDTRPNGDTFDGLLQRSGARAADSETTIQVAGRAGIAVDATTVVLNVTTTNAAGRGFFTVYPCGDRPNAANLNFEQGQIIANSVVAKLNSDGETCVYTNTKSNMIVDVTGALPGDTYTSLDEPRRIVDSRPNGNTADGIVQRDGYRRAGTTLSLPVVGRVEIPDNATAVVLNVTATNAQDRGFLTLHPRNSQRPNAANLNYEPGRAIANTVIAPIGGGGNVCLFASAGTEVIVDVAGFFTGDEVTDADVDCPFEFPGISNSFDDPYPVGPYQLQPGRYTAAVTDELFCSPRRLGSDDFFDVNGIIDPFEGPPVIDVIATDEFVHYGFASCPPLVPYEAPTGNPPSTFTSGYYVVNSDISPGLYQSSDIEPGTSRCGAFRYNSFLGNPAFGRPDTSVIESVLSPEGFQTIRVQASDVGVSFGNTCDPWTRIGG